MSDLFHSAASAALPVAIVLLVLGASARGVLWAQIDDPRWVRIARQYLAPLSTWAVAGFITYALALVAAGEAATGPLALALVLAVAAAVIRLEGDEEERAPAPRVGGEAAFAAPGQHAEVGRREAVFADRERARGEAVSAGRAGASGEASAARREAVTAG
ncbi:hypothetical protein OJ998_32175, partial [Solirubrobacter taibaiensis]|nr:hypothetical protein [Solirubrobacter taibaiensis]